MPFGGSRRKTKKSLARRYFDAQPVVRAANSKAMGVAGAARAETAKIMGSGSRTPDMSGVRAGLNQAASGAIEKASKINRVMFPSIGQAVADMPRSRVNPANFPTSYGERARSTKEDQPARARFRGSRRAAGRVSLRIPSLGGF